MTNPSLDPFGKFEAPTTVKFMAHVGIVFCLAYLMGWVDKANIGFAKLQMLDDLHLTEAGFALSASMFFIGYVLVDLPIALVLPKIRPAHMLAGMVFSFGVVTALLALTRNAATLGTLRFLLGVSEGGLAPAIFLYVASWTPYMDRLRVSGLILALALAANVFGSVLCGAILDLDGLGGLRGWQLLFLFTALPSILLSAVALWRVPDGPNEAPFLTDNEKAALARTLAAEQGSERIGYETSLVQVLKKPVVWALFALGAAGGVCTYGLSYWLPTVVRQFGVSNSFNGLLSAIPWLLGIVAMIWLPMRAEQSARTGAWILACALSGAMAFALIPLNSNPIVCYVLICLGGIGSLALQPFVLVLPSRFLRGRPLAYTFALGALVTNCIAFLAQNAIARIGQAYGPSAGMLLVAGGGAMMALLMARLYQLSERPTAVAFAPARSTAR